VINKKVVASRTYFVNGEDAKISIQIYEPYSHHESKSFRCRFEFVGAPDDFEPMEASGIDSLQALSLALEMAQATVEHLNDQVLEHKLRWTNDDLHLW
jgi:hypothetical protein